MTHRLPTATRHERAPAMFPAGSSGGFDHVIEAFLQRFVGAGNAPHTATSPC